MLEMNFDPAHATQLAERAERRTNLFVAATLSWPQGFAPTTIRNLSPGGALIEASVLPKPGISVQLARGCLRVEGEVVWCEGRRAGLKFGGRIAVVDWLPSGSGMAQAHLDQAVHAVKAGLPIKQLKTAPSPVTASRTLLEEAAELQALLGIVTDGLAEDPSVIGDHGEKLQLLDIVRHRLEKLSERLGRF